MKKRILFAIVLLCCAWQGTVVKAGDIDDLRTQLAEQQKLLLKMQQKIEMLDEQQKTQASSIDQKIEKAVESNPSPSLSDSAKWVENITWSGDFRYRHESISDDTKSADRDRNRIRARLKLEAKVTDEWDAIFRIATGSSDSPTSTNHTLGDSGGDGFSSRDLWLDWAYGNYHPKSLNGLNIMFGKMGNPFYKVAKHQLIIDGDVSPEGIAARYARHLDKDTVLTTTAGGYWVREREDDADTSLFGFQTMLKHKLDSNRHILAGVSYYDFGNIQGEELSGISSKGNSTTNGVFDSDYDLLECFGEYGFKMGAMPTAVYGSYINNIDCIDNEDTAWIVGCKFNKAKKPGSWEASYNYRDLEANAVVGGLNDSDFIGGGTNGRGHVMGYKYQITNNVQAAVKYFINTKNANGTKDDFSMLQADLILKF